MPPKPSALAEGRRIAGNAWWLSSGLGHYSKFDFDFDFDFDNDDEL